MTASHVVEARQLGKKYGKFWALRNATFAVPSGRIVGVIGANGAGKTTLLNSILGLTRYQGHLQVLGREPAICRAHLMQDVSFISDVATLPRWMSVKQVLSYVESVHPKFMRAKALQYLSRTTVPLTKKIRALSKGMVTQTHLALAMAIDARLLILDEPTLGLDIIYRKNFYSSLLEEYFDKKRTVIITTHQVEEIEHILTDALFIKNGEIILYQSIDSLRERFSQLTTDEKWVAQVRKFKPILETRTLARHTFVFDGLDRSVLKDLGDVREMDLADIFFAVMTGETK